MEVMLESGEVGSNCGARGGEGQVEGGGSGVGEVRDEEQWGRGS